ncbi:DNA-directed RNA polymerase I subunit 1 [Nymphaea thermarum]|nr:DNA-directed RNA polymerase I subunit 1 [Nymphaea thermarum]
MDPKATAPTDPEATARNPRQRYGFRDSGMDPKTMAQIPRRQRAWILRRWRAQQQNGSTDGLQTKDGRRNFNGVERRQVPRRTIHEKRSSPTSMALIPYALKDTKPGHSISLQNLNQWIQLQEAVNVLFDSSKATSRSERTIKGICQILDKKDGLFRQNMMGKRVNFACRSVISPDPYLAVNEIGIPPYFAMRLTYPELPPATNWYKSLKMTKKMFAALEAFKKQTEYG